MAHPFIEHVNMTVSDPERSAALMARIFGWHERWRGPARDGGMAIHVGSDEAYVALYTGPDGLHANAHFAKGEPHGDYEPGRRFYFFDPDGIEYEVVSYAARAAR